MEKNEFNAKAVCPLDGRYAKIGEELSEYFSEYSLVENRVYVEIKWLCYILNNQDIKLNDFTKKERLSISSKLDNICIKFGMTEFNKIKEIESTTKHDVKAVEYFIDECLDNLGLEKIKSLVHIGCTSEDINNISYALMLKDGLYNVWIKKAVKLIDQAKLMANKYADIPMLAHTHGQPATPTTVGKEFRVFAYRLKESLNNILYVRFKAKFNGATGNYSAISVAFPEINWEKSSKEFIMNYLGLDFSPITTQIEGHDYMCHLLDGIRHFNNVVLDMNLDMWLYISMDYIKQIPVEGEVGSSTMPHKINPIKFENSEANIDMSNSICMSLSNKLPKSRLQRDLSDSSSQRNLGLAIGYSVQAINETVEGLKKCSINEEKIKADLNDKWEVLAEPIQTMLRKYGIPDAYDTLKELTRGKNVSKKDIQSFIKTLDCLSEIDKKTLLEMTPSNYIGYAEKLANKEFDYN
ncbi:MAG: adenylosuccinate lyase [Bacilli bacterium]|nr:adenylosuccinate lyase [Bacilli bacterium]